MGHRNWFSHFSVNELKEYERDAERFKLRFRLTMKQLLFFSKQKRKDVGK